MEHTKSRIEKYLGVVRNLLDDIADLTEEFAESCDSSSSSRALCSLNLRREIARDFEYILSRTSHESVTFLTVTLPVLGKFYDQVITKRLGIPIPPGFKPWHRISTPAGNCGSEETLNTFPTSCPLFCRTFAYVLLCDGGSDSLKARVIRAYRSLFYLFYKLECPLTPEQETAALEKWRRNEEELLNFEYPFFYDEDVSRARDLISDLLAPGPSLFTKIKPKHGPGAVAGREVGDEKWTSIRLIRSLNRVYPWYEYLWPNAALSQRSPNRTMDLISHLGLKGGSATSRLLFVPKDSRGPRVISCEPKELMFIQQGVARNLMRVFSARSNGRVQFLDQSINGKLALASSKSNEFATVDLQDASDRVSWKLVKLLFPEWAHRYLEATRSSLTLLPGGEEYPHSKYAPMGSALCFPIESVIFWALGVVATLRCGHALDVAKATTYVYGDDIIILSEAFDQLVRVFTKVGLIVNVGKSYVDGPFRESCGVDAWKGYDVTPFKVKKDWCSRSLDGPLAAAVCEYSSRCFALDLRRTGKYLHQVVESQYPGVPVIPEGTLPCLHVVDNLNWSYHYSGPSGWNDRMCKSWFVGWVLETPAKTTDLTGFNRLLKNLHGNWEMHDPGKVVVPRATKIRKRRILVEGWPF